jgi:hypothetical protein
MNDVPKGSEFKPGQRLDPLLHYAGRTEVRFTGETGTQVMLNAAGLIDHNAMTVASSHRQLLLDYRSGILRIDAPKAQGVSGNLKAMGKGSLRDLEIESGLDLAHIVVVSLDGQPIKTSKRMLLQAMSEEQNSGWRTEPAEGGKKRIASIGRDPWEIRPIEGTVRLKRDDAGSLKVTALDHNGRPNGDAGHAREIKLLPGALYYSITAQ